MRRILYTLAIAIIGFLLSTHANAEEVEQGKDWSYGLHPEEQRSWAFGVHLISLHKPGTGMRTITPGAYIMHNDTGLTAGAYNNSHGRLSVYAGMTLERGPFQLTLGVVTGYSKARILPMVAPSYKHSSGWRVSIIPNPFGHSALHLSKEF